MQRLGIFAHFDLEGEVKPYVIHYLEALRPHCTRLVFVTTSGVPADRRPALERLCDELTERENLGFDFGMWQHVIQRTDLNALDELLLTNSSVFGPLYPLAHVFERMRYSGADFWGITDSLSMKWHLQSYFLVFGRAALRANAFRQFWSSLLLYRSKWQTILSHEIGLSRYLSEAGLVGRALIPSETLFPEGSLGRLYPNRLDNATAFNPLRLLVRGAPFVKVDLLRDNPAGVQLAPVRRAMAQAGYDPHLIAFDRPGRSRPRYPRRIVDRVRARLTTLWDDRHVRATPPPPPIPIVIAIDVEPNQRVCDREQPLPWTGFERCLPYFETLRATFERETQAPARFSWFLRMDPQIEDVYGSLSFVVNRYGEDLAGLVARGDDLGLHVHSWRWSEALHTFVTDTADAEWVRRCVRGAFAAYETAFGRRCRSFRFGDRWHDTAYLPLLRDLGVEVDLTLEPRKPAVRVLSPGEQTTGSIPATLGAPETPYRPSRHSWLARDDAAVDGPWMLPLSAGPVNRRETAFDTLGWWLPPLAFRRIAERALSAGPRPYLAGVIRSDLPHQPAMRNFQDNMRWLANHAWRRRFRFCTPSEAIAMLTAS